MANMTAIGVSGLDLYVKTESGDWRWLGVGQPTAQTNQVKLTENLIFAWRLEMVGIHGHLVIP